MALKFFSDGEKFLQICMHGDLAVHIWSKLWKLTIFAMKYFGEKKLHHLKGFFIATLFLHWAVSQRCHKFLCLILCEVGKLVLRQVTNKIWPKFEKFLFFLFCEYNVHFLLFVEERVLNFCCLDYLKAKRRWFCLQRHCFLLAFPKFLSQCCFEPCKCC